MSTSPASHRQAITRLQRIGIGLIIASLGWQLLQLTQQHDGHASAELPANAPLASAPAASATALTQLFAEPANGLVAAPTPANSTLRLLACFTGTGNGPSSALLAIDGQAARRVHTGQQILPGVAVAAIQAQSIDIAGNGRTYRLRLGRNAPVSQPVVAFNSFALPSISSITEPE
jgi:hypothetical protein